MIEDFKSWFNELEESAKSYEDMTGLNFASFMIACPVFLLAFFILELFFGWVALLVYIPAVFYATKYDYILSYIFFDEFFQGAAEAILNEVEKRQSDNSAAG